MRLAKRRRVGPSDPMAVVQRFLEAANQHDSDALYASVHPEFESLQPLHPIRNFRGPGQLITNWKAIFEAEPGFRLTVLRASTTGNTVWVEVHGAGASAEASGIFIVGVEEGRIRWIRVYSDLIEALPEVAEPEPVAAAGHTAGPDGEDGPEPLRLVPATVGAGEGDAAGPGDDATDVPSLRLVERGQGTDDGPGSDADAGVTTATAGLRLVAPDDGDEASTPPSLDASSTPGGHSVEVLVGDTRAVAPKEEGTDANGSAADPPPPGWEDPDETAAAAGDAIDSDSDTADTATTTDHPDGEEEHGAVGTGWRRALKRRKGGVRS